MRTVTYGNCCAACVDSWKNGATSLAVGKVGTHYSWLRKLGPGLITGAADDISCSTNGSSLPVETYAAIDEALLHVTQTRGQWLTGSHATRQPGVGKTRSGFVRVSKERRPGEPYIRLRCAVQRSQAFAVGSAEVPRSQRAGVSISSVCMLCENLDTSLRHGFALL